MGLYPARQRKLTFSIGDLAATVWIGGAEILLSSLKDLAINSGFSLNLPHCKKRWLFFDTKRTNINPLIAPPPHLDINYVSPIDCLVMSISIYFNQFSCSDHFLLLLFIGSRPPTQMGGPSPWWGRQCVEAGRREGPVHDDFPFGIHSGDRRGCIYIYIYMYTYILYIVYYNYICAFIIYIYMYIWLVVWNMAFMTFHHIGNVIIPTDELHHFSEG